MKFLLRWFDCLRFVNLLIPFALWIIFHMHHHHYLTVMLCATWLFAIRLSVRRCFIYIARIRLFSRSRVRSHTHLLLPLSLSIIVWLDRTFTPASHALSAWNMDFGYHYLSYLDHVVLILWQNVQKTLKHFVILMRIEITAKVTEHNGNDHNNDDNTNNSQLRWWRCQQRVDNNNDADDNKWWYDYFLEFTMNRFRFMIFTP